MRLCIVSEFFYPDMTGGTGMLLSDLARNLHDDCGVEIDVITTRHLYRDPTAKLAAHEDWNGIQIHRVAAPNFNRAGTAKRLVGNLLFSSSAIFSLLTKKRYDVVLTATAPPTIPIAAQSYGRMTKTPYVYIIYDLEPDRVVKMQVMASDSKPVRLLRFAQQSWLSQAGKVVVIGRCMQDYLHENYGLDRDHMEVIAVGADAERIQPRDKNTDMRRRLGLSGFVVLYAGNFGQYHNFNVVLDAAKTLQSEDADITFAFVGNGAQEAHIRARVIDEAIDNVKVFPIVPQNDVPELLASADVCLVTLEPNMEGLCVPSKFYPILASGRPTIAMVGEKSEVARVLAEANCGIRVPQESPEGLAEAVLRLYRSPETVQRQGENARQVILENYTLRQITKQFYQTLSTCANRKTGSTMALEAVKESANESCGASL